MITRGGLTSNKRQLRRSRDITSQTLSRSISTMQDFWCAKDGRSACNRPTLPLRLGPPVDGELAGQPELAERHLGGDGVAHARPGGAVLARGVAGRAGEPLVRLDPVLRHALAAVVHEAQLVLRAGVVLLGRAEAPDRGLVVALRNAAAVIVHKAHIELRHRNALLGQWPQEARGRDIVRALDRSDARAQR